VVRFYCSQKTKALQPGKPSVYLQFIPALCDKTLGENLTGLFNGTSPLSLHLPDLGAYTAPKVAIDVIGITYYDELIKFNIRILQPRAMDSYSKCVLTLSAMQEGGYFCNARNAVQLAYNDPVLHGAQVHRRVFLFAPFLG
jgi:hypothetical protein